MDINFIVTCFDHEDYLPYLEEVFKSYKKIIPHYFICYNGKKDYFPCHLRIQNFGLHMGDLMLIKTGYELSKFYNDFPRFVKIGIDTFLLKEDKIIEIFSQMEDGKNFFAGQWDNIPGITIKSDIFFCDTRFGNVFDNLKFDETQRLEGLLANAVRKEGKGWLPIVRSVTENYDEELGWVFSHNIGYNIESFKKFKILMFEVQKDKKPPKSVFLEKLKKNWYYTKEIWKN
jgi:hypothetical protein